MKHARGNTPWDEGCVQVLRVLWAEGLSASQIAKRLNKPPLNGGFSRNAVIAKLHRLGLTKRATVQSYRTDKPRTQNIGKPKPKREHVAPKHTPTVHKQIGAERGDWNKRYGDVMGLPVCKRFVAEESGLDGFVCARPIPIGSWCENCKRDCFQPLKLVSAA